MKITFCLPNFSSGPSGGYKIVFEYANRLTRLGHNICIVFDCNDTLKRHNLPVLLRKILCRIFVRYWPKWFVLDKNIKKICIFGIDNYQVPNGDIIIATAVSTAYGVANLSSNKGGKIYFIQDYEKWGDNTAQYLQSTYKLGMTNIVIAKWLKKIVDQYDSGNSVLIPNGVDFNIFNIDKDIRARDKYSLAMLYHSGEHKGAKYGLLAISQVKRKYPQLKVHLFSSEKRPAELPNWIEFTQNASESYLRKLYNETAIFICSSINEGFGLTGAESMACGCAFVSSDYGGVHEYAEEGRNVLLSPPKNVNHMVKNIILLLENDDMRIQLAKNAHDDIKRLSWNNSLKLFEETMKRCY